MPQFSYPLYDTAPLGTSADVTHTLFQVSQGADATHTKQFTNMRGSGSLPQGETFTIRRIYATLWGLVAEADIPLLFDGSYLELRISDESVLQAPLAIFAGYNAYGGVLAQAAASDFALVGKEGMGYIVEPRLTIPGGTSFRVDVFQDNALSAAENMWIILEGILDRQ